MTSLSFLKFTSLVILASLGAVSFNGVTAQETGLSLTVELKEFEGSGITGTAFLIETTAGGTLVSMELRGQELDGNHPTHIHTGTCDNFDPNPLYPLETVVLSPVNREGISDSHVEGASLASLRSGDFVILVHQSPEELTNYLICGEIGSGTLGVATKATATDAHVPHHLPNAGSGVTDVSNVWSSNFPLIGFSTLAVISVMSAGALWHRQR